MSKIKHTADQFLQWFCEPEFYQDIQGDLDELYLRSETNRHGSSLKWQHARSILGLFRPGIIRSDLLSHTLPKRAMIKLHFLTALRNMRRNRAYSFINIFGLALGLAACLVVFAHSRFEQSYDRDHPNVDRLYRVNQTAIWSPEGGIMGSTPPPVAELLKKEFAGIEDATRINTPPVDVVRYEGPTGEIRAFNESEILAADSNFFEFFEVPLIEGSTTTALRGPNKVVLSADAAERYFGTTSCLDEVLLFGEDRRSVIVSGVAAPQPKNRHFSFDFLWSMPTNPGVEQFDWSYIWTQMVTYVRLTPESSVADLENRFRALADVHVKPSFSRLGMDFEEFAADKGGWNFFLQPVTQIHLHSSEYGNRIGPVGDGQVIRLLRYVAFLILIIAILNFINISTARASTRSKEIGVKKTIGAGSNSLLGQFLVESITVVMLASVLAIPLVYQLAIGIKAITEIEIPVATLLRPEFVPMYLLLPLVLGLVAGIYPALQFSRVKPNRVFSGLGGHSMSKSNFRNVLVVIQFTIAIALMSGALLLHRQMNFMLDKDLGFDGDRVLVVNNAAQLGSKLQSFRDEIAQLPGVEQVALGMDIPGRGSWEDIYQREGSEKKVSISQYKVDDAFVPTLGLEIVKGRNFDRTRPADLNAIIINETTEESFGWEDGAIGKKIIYPGFPHELMVIGVMKDFHFQSLRQPIGPKMFFHIDSEMWGDQRLACIKFRSGDQQAVLSEVKKLWERISNNSPFSHSFFDEELQVQYEGEQQTADLLSIFTGFSIFLAVLGLVGLLAFSAQQRRREIGIRKVLGASIWQVYLMLNRQYVLLFVVALFLAVPLAWRSMSGWLATFAYHTEIRPSLFLLAGAVVITISIISVSYLSVRAASVNLAEELKE